MAILNKKVESDGLFIENEILEFIAANIKSNIRELEGSLNKLVALSRLKKKEINMELVEEAIQDYISIDSHKTITLPYIVDIVADWMSFGGRSLEIIICFLDSCRVLNVWKNSSCVLSFPIIN